MFVVLVVVLLIDRFSVAILSHPVEPVNVTLYEPAALMVCPFQVYGN
jgi:hypothetical protein